MEHPQQEEMAQGGDPEHEKKAPGIFFGPGKQGRPLGEMPLHPCYYPERSLVSLTGRVTIPSFSTPAARISDMICTTTP